MDNDDNVMDPQENPAGTGHLPSAGEVGNGEVSYHDPVTQPTDDDVQEEQTHEVSQPDEPEPGNGGATGLS